MCMKQKKKLNKNDRRRGEFKFQNAHYTMRHVLRRKVSSLIFFFFSFWKNKIKEFLHPANAYTDALDHVTPDSPYGPDNNN